MHPPKIEKLAKNTEKQIFDSSGHIYIDYENYLNLDIYINKKLSKKIEKEKKMKNEKFIEKNIENSSNFFQIKEQKKNLLSFKTDERLKKAKNNRSIIYSSRIEKLKNKESRNMICKRNVIIIFFIKEIFC